jgi:hypothetical protein
VNPSVSPAQGLPRGIRLAAWVCLVLSAFTGFFALQETLKLGHLAELRDQAINVTRFSKDADLIAFARLTEAELAALEPMRDSRSLVLGALSVVCAFVFVSSGRLLRPGGGSLERARRLLSGAAIAAAVLRTIDGAQLAVVGRSMGPALARFISAQPTYHEATTAAQLEAGMAWLASLTMMGLTALIAGTFALLGQYFRSEHVRQVIVAQSSDLAEEED